MNPPGPELRDIHLPPDPSWWPPAPGWWILAAIAIGMIIWATRALRRRARERLRKRRILGELDRIAVNPESTDNPTILIGELSQLLRRASRLVDADAPSLHGSAWLAFLDSVLGGDDFSRGVGQALLHGPYRREAHVDVDALIDLVRRWMIQIVETRVPHA